MKNEMLNNRFMKWLICLLLLQASAVISYSQEWVVPADRQGRLSTFIFTDSVRQAGNQIYNLSCKSCHGTPGMGDVQRLTPPPVDPATQKMQQNSDGALFYKISEGRTPMPSFKSTMTSVQIWAVISYIRSFNTAYVQSVMPEITSSAYPGALITISLGLNARKDSVLLKASAVRGNTSEPVTGAGVMVFVIRTFGQLPVDEEKTTDRNGKARFALPVNLPGDTAGNINFSARFTNEELFGSVSKDTLLAAGLQVIPVSLTAPRAMWNVVRKAPVWTILTYGFGVLLVWGFIFLVLFKLRDIYTIGEYMQRNKQKTIHDQF